MLKEVTTKYEHYFTGAAGRKHGEYKKWRRSNGQLELHVFYINGQLHGEHKRFASNGSLYLHCFYVNGKPVPFSKIPLPKTEEEKMYFKMKHGLPLLSV